MDSHNSAAAGEPTPERVTQDPPSPTNAVNGASIDGDSMARGAANAGADGVGRAGGGLLSFDGDDQDWNIVSGNEIDGKSVEDLQSDLTQLEDEINTLKQVLQVKEKKANDIRRRLGVTPIQLISDSFYGGIKTITHSNAMQKTSENVKYFGQSYLVEGSKSAASYTKSGLSSLGSGMVSGMGSLKGSRLFSSMYGFKPNPAEEEKFVEVVAPPQHSFSVSGAETDDEQKGTGAQRESNPATATPAST